MRLPTGEEIAAGLPAAPWGLLRYRVVEHTLATVLAASGDSSVHVLDVGCGDGRDAVALARAGHHVTALDSSAGMLERARTHARSGRAAVEWVLGDLENARTLDRPAGGFDLVLCHDVLQHRPAGTLEADLGRLAPLVRPGGLLSVLAPNPAADVLRRAVRDLDPTAASELLDVDRFPDTVTGDPTWRLDPERVATALSVAGFDVGRRFAVRVVTDLVADDTLKGRREFYERLLALELRLSDRPEFLGAARSWQLVATRRDPSTGHSGRNGGTASGN